LNRFVSPPVAPRLPLPMVNMISGGLHAGGNLDFQDVLISPHGATSYRIALEWTVRIYRRLGRLLNDAGYEGRLVGDEGGFGPRLSSNREAAEFVVRAINAAGLRPGEEVSLALDVAATHFFEEGNYRLASEGGCELTRDEMIEHLASWVETFPIDSIEDGLAEEDWEGWQSLYARLGDKVHLVGDDLLATNPLRVKKAIALNAANAVLVKMNQIGTLSETFETIRVAREAGMSLVVSARSGETEDSSLADLAVAVAAEQIKIGSIVRSERLAKYNRLLRIEEELSPPADSGRTRP
jgi:enolase